MKREFYNDLLYGGYSIFLKGKATNSDDVLLKLFGIEEIKLLSNENQLDFFNYEHPKVYVTENGNWKHVIDNWSYSLRHRYISRSFQRDKEDVILKLSKEYEILEFFVSDVDESYGFRFLSEGELKRSYSVQPLNGSYSETFVAVDLGNEQKSEREILKRKGGLAKIKGICELYNVQYQQKIENIRCYNIIK